MFWTEIQQAPVDHPELPPAMSSERVASIHFICIDDDAKQRLDLQRLLQYLGQVPGDMSEADTGGEVSTLTACVGESLSLQLKRVLVSVQSDVQGSQRMLHQKIEARGFL